MDPSKKDKDFSRFLSFGDFKEDNYKRREPVVRVYSAKLESTRKKLLSIVRDVKWNQSRLCMGISMAHLYHHPKVRANWCNCGLNHSHMTNFLLRM